MATKSYGKIVKTKSHFHESLKNPNEKTFFLTPTTAAEVEDHLKFLNDRRKAIGINGIPTKQFWKHSKKVLLQSRTEQCNLICSTGTFPYACMQDC